MVFTLRSCLYSSAAVGAFGAAREPGKWISAASDCIKVTPDKQDDWAKHDFTYPSNYASTCNQAGQEPGSYHCTWKQGMKAKHAFANGGTYNSKWDSEDWCSKKFCWVDPCACDKTDISKSTWLNSHYSYSMCGATDTYTPAKCSTNTDATACNAATGCKWATTCIAQTGTEAMVALRTKMSCTNPAVVPVGCACKANTETQIKCNVANTKLWSPTITTPTATSTNSGHANSDHADTSDATKIKIGTMTALLLLALPK